MARGTVHLDLTEREARATARAISLVREFLRPALFAGDTRPRPLTDAHAHLLGACERAGVEVGDPFVRYAQPEDLA